MKNNNFIILKNADTSTSVVTQAIDTGQMVAGSFQFVFGDDTSAGECKIQVSNSPNISPFEPIWVDIPNTGSQVGAVHIYEGCSVMLFLPATSFRWLRATFEPDVGSIGTVTILANTIGF